ncbi:hypothetical protein G6011_07662 [Alternaria panax]|uniref:Uncharacterized protein n=1 Tax=Alternaria panax TaxID=48097 RepID=A0AAD4FAF9_9PLEO|nr:hypothetical protein G6011_07662 [Alternaria panax]
MTASSTSQTRFTPKTYNDAWQRADQERNYKDLCREYALLSAEVVRATRPFDRERTIHNLLNARLKLEHQLETLKNIYLEEQAKSQRNLEEVRNESPVDGANPDIVAELRKELQSSKDTLEDVLYGVNQFQDSTMPFDHGGTMGLTEGTVQLQIQNTVLRKRLADLEREKRRTREGD